MGPKHNSRYPFKRKMEGDFKKKKKRSKRRRQKFHQAGIRVTLPQTYGCWKLKEARNEFFPRTMALLKSDFVSVIRI